eukprot:TRINITY_DN68127_c10_g1_i1.p1 TRINITY_DN68127_c10_g1~~TRINITY_DN68127_c10_g1_i1.p1  ORF type:complete len:289 (-),score=19.29 TRINITY_DN68127_c10_g1_i1:335-1201(-)
MLRSLARPQIVRSGHQRRYFFSNLADAIGVPPFAFPCAVAGLAYFLSLRKPPPKAASQQKSAHSSSAGASKAGASQDSEAQQAKPATKPPSEYEIRKHMQKLHKQNPEMFELKPQDDRLEDCLSARDDMIRAVLQMDNHTFALHSQNKKEGFTETQYVCITDFTRSMFVKDINFGALLPKGDKTKDGTSEPQLTPEMIIAAMQPPTEDGWQTIPECTYQDENVLVTGYENTKNQDGYQFQAMVHFPKQDKCSVWGFGTQGLSQEDREDLSVLKRKCLRFVWGREPGDK